jgi:NADH dehydrogenase
MKIAITGGTGFVGSHLARSLVASGHEVVIIARGIDERDTSVRELSRAQLVLAGIDNRMVLEEAFHGCDGVAHLAGINREVGRQTYRLVHVEGTRNVVEAARAAGVRRILFLSFLRARPDCGSAYHESKWAAEEIVRNSGLDYTILKSGVIYGRGDHMLDHLSHTFYTLPLFGLVGFREKRMRPVAVEEVARIAQAALVEGRLTGQSVAVLGPEELSLREAVSRVARATHHSPLFIRLPVFFHYAMGALLERIMKIPVVSIAQVRILSEGLVDPAPPCDPLPLDLAPALPFRDEQIIRGLPPAGPFRMTDLRCSLPVLGSR